MTKVHIIAGFLGAGKSTAILDLFMQKPTHESWGLIVNEFGQVSIDHALFTGKQGLTVAEVPGGCICCSSDIPLAAVLQQMMSRELPLDRILIEPSGMGHLNQIIQTVQSFSGCTPLALAPSIVLVDIPAWIKKKQTSYQLFWDQIHSADILIGTKAEMVTDDDHEAWIEWAEDIYPPKLSIDLSFNKKFKQSLLHQGNYSIIVPNEHSPYAPDTLQTHQKGATSSEIQRFSKKRIDAFEHGWIFPTNYRFDLSSVRAFFEQMHDVFRAKGVFKTEKNTYLFNAVSGEFTVEWIAYDKDSRLEIISLSPIDWSEWEQKLNACITHNNL